jgi:electron transfer flavoprotein alpha subunit
MVFVYIESVNGQIKKSSLEVLTYGKKMATQMSTTVCAISLTAADAAVVGSYGACRLFQVSDARFEHFDSKAYAKAIAEIFSANNGKILVLPFNQNGKALAPRLSVRLKAGLVNGTNALADTSAGFVVRKSVFSGKAVANYSINTDVKIISVAANSLPLEKNETTCESIPTSVSVTDADFSSKFIKNELVSGDIPLSEAELVVSAGRGLKGPENWGMIEDCAKILGAATACSRAVADVHWRPHHEHVGQTGLAISPNLYIAVGISGAIQHLAGVSSSKTIVVINTDAEAPFFKAADYGIVGDAFEVMPKFNEALKRLKG